MGGGGGEIDRQADRHRQTDSQPARQPKRERERGGGGGETDRQTDSQRQI